MTATCGTCGGKVCPGCGRTIGKRSTTCARCRGTDHLLAALRAKEAKRRAEAKVLLAQGLQPKVVARRIGVDRSTINRYAKEFDDGEG